MDICSGVLGTGASDISGALRIFIGWFSQTFSLLYPVTLTIIYAGIFHGYSYKERLKVAQISCGTAWMVLVGGVLIGADILQSLGIFIWKFGPAGGILLLAICFAITRIPGTGDKLKELRASETLHAWKRLGVAIVPFGVPLIVGPAALKFIMHETETLSAVGALVLAVSVTLSMALLYGMFYLTAKLTERVNEEVRQMLFLPSVFMLMVMTFGLLNIF